MEFIVLSDNHGKTSEMAAILEKYPNSKAFIHCGDNELSLKEMAPFHAVTGNNDYDVKYPDELVVDLGELSVYITHGHLLRYGHRVQDLVARAKSRGCAIACTGHTHVYMDETVDGVRVINPGSLYYNRDGSKPCYAHVFVEEGVITVTRCMAEDL